MAALKWHCEQLRQAELALQQAGYDLKKLDQYTDRQLLRMKGVGPLRLSLLRRFSGIGTKRRTAC
jgi:hypothetical protein